MKQIVNVCVLVALIAAMPVTIVAAQLADLQKQLGALKETRTRKLWDLHGASGNKSYFATIRSQRHIKQAYRNSMSDLKLALKTKYLADQQNELRKKVDELDGALQKAESEKERELLARQKKEQQFMLDVFAEQQSFAENMVGKFEKFWQWRMAEIESQHSNAIKNRARFQEDLNALDEEIAAKESEIEEKITAAKKQEKEEQKKAKEEKERRERKARKKVEPFSLT